MNYTNIVGSFWILFIAPLCLMFFNPTSATNEDEKRRDPGESDFSSSPRRNLLAFQRSPNKKEDQDYASSCLFSGKRYAIGQKWQHILDPSTANICVSCSCHQVGKVTCESNYCSDLNCEDEEPDECCQICGDDDVTASDRPTSWSDESHKEIPCFHDGRKIWDGQIFSSNSTGIQKTRSDQCVQCVCQSGMVLCRLKTCLNSDCPTPVYVSDDCCPTCPEQYSSAPYAGNNNQRVGTVESTKDCLSGGHLYSEGEQWHPVIGPFGQMDCVLCQCQKGKIDCNRLSCPEAPPCARPRQIPGQCCPVCPGTDGEKKNNKCFPQSTDTIVYKDFSEELFQFAFQPTEGHVKIVSLTLKDDRTLKFAEQSYTTKEFTNKIKSGKFKVIGTTRSRLAQRFEKKAKRLSERCVNRCEKRIERLENALKLKEIDTGCAIGIQV